MNRSITYSHHTTKMAERKAKNGYGLYLFPLPRGSGAEYQKRNRVLQDGRHLRHASHCTACVFYQGLSGRELAQQVHRYVLG